MKKLRMELDDLQVESFATDRGDGDRGTVEGHVSAQCSAGAFTCNGGNTCVEGATCGNNESCYVSCNGSCPYPCTNEVSYCFNNTCFDCSFPKVCIP